MRARTFLKSLACFVGMLVALGFTISSADAAAAEYQLALIPIGAQPGAIRNIFNVTNDRGLIAGFHANWTNRKGQTGGFTAALYDGKRFTTLPTLGGRETVVYAINSIGALAGASDTADGNSHAFLWLNGRMTDLGTLGGRSSTAFAINAQNTVVGASDAPDGSQHAVLWRHGRLIDFNELVPRQYALLGGESYVFSSATGINDTEDVLLWAKSASGRAALFLLKDQRLRTLAFPKNWRSLRSAGSLNDDDSFAGSFLTLSGREQGFVYTRDTFHDVGTISGASRIYRLNGSGQAVGESRALDGYTHAVLWDGDGLTDLNALFDRDKRTRHGHLFRLASATSIDSSGRVVGVAWEEERLPHDAVFILTPEPRNGFWRWAIPATVLAAILAFASIYMARNPGALLPVRASGIQVQRIFSRVTAANAASSVAWLGHALIALAVLQGLLFVVLAALNLVPPTVFIDPLVYGASGSFLTRRRSRAIAVFVFVYALFALTAAVLSSSGWLRQIVVGTAAVTAGYIALQATRAAWFDQRTRTLVTDWRNVAFVSFATIFIFALSAAFLGYWARRAGFHIENSNVFGLVALAAAMVAIFGVMAPLSGRRPFARARDSTA